MAEKISIREYLALAAALFVAGVAGTTAAFAIFEQKENARERESRLERRLDRVEELQVETMRAFNIQVPPKREP